MGIVKVVTVLLLLSIQYFNSILISYFFVLYIYIYIYIRAVTVLDFFLPWRSSNKYCG